MSGPAILRLVGLATTLLTFPVSALRAQTCSVPGERPTVQTAVADPTCSLVMVTPGGYPESVTIRRTVAVASAGGAPPSIEGRLVVESPVPITVELQGLVFDATGVRAGCYASAMEVRGQATVVPEEVYAFNEGGVPAAPCPLFADGFESGATSAWSSGP
jgi:hypothetical protein